MTAINFGGQNVLRLASNLILTRILFPEAFGLMALVQVILAGTAMFADLGIMGSIVQSKRGEDPAFLNTAWTIQIGRGLFLGLVILLFAPSLADFYEEPRLGVLLTLAALIPVIEGFSSTRMATANRNIALGHLAALALGSQVIGIICMILLAWWTNSVWAMIIGMVIQTIVHTLLSHVVLPGTLKNRLHFEKAAALELFSFGKYIFLATLATFLTQHGDRAILGKFISLEELAIYNIGFLIAVIPLKFAQRLSLAVIFPLYARRPPWEGDGNRGRINRARYLLSAGLIGSVVVLALVGDAMVRFMYDPRYHGGGPILALIAITLIPRMITISYERLPLAAGKSGRHAFFSISRSVLFIGLSLIGVMQYGMLGVIIAPLVTWVLIYPVLIAVIRPFKGWDPLHDALYAVIAAALIAALLCLQLETISPLLQLQSV